MDKQIIEDSKLHVSRNMYIISIVAFTLISVCNYFDNIVYFIQAVSALTLSTLCLALLLLTKNYKTPVYVIIFSSIIIHGIGYLTSSFVENQTDIYWIIVFSLFSYYTVGKAWSFFYLVLNISNLVIVKLLVVNQNMTPPIEAIEPHLASEINFVLNMLACTVLQVYQMNQILREFRLVNHYLLSTNAVLHSKDIEKSTMLKEIHHRVKNNLQVIISLLRLQLFQIDHNDEVSRPFQDSINRISTMALIHEKMYKGGKINNLSVESYVNDLANDLVRSYATYTKVSVTVSSNIDQLEMNDLVPLSLILNELITNSIKHGFRKDSKGQIDIKLVKTTVGFDLIYKDSGVWKENNNGQRFGLELIETLSGHFDGSYRKNITDSGTEFNFKLKLS